MPSSQTSRTSALLHQYCTPTSMLLITTGHCPYFRRPTPKVRVKAWRRARFPRCDARYTMPSQDLGT